METVSARVRACLTLYERYLIHEQNAEATLAELEATLRQLTPTEFIQYLKMRRRVLEKLLQGSQRGIKC